MVESLRTELKGYQRAFEAEKDTKELFENLKNLTEDIADLSSAGLNIFSAQAKGIYVCHLSTSILSSADLMLQRDFWNVILPRLISSIKEIPLPR